MALPPPPAGWTRVVVKSTFGMGRDFEVADVEGNAVLYVDGKVGMTPKAEVRAGAALDQVVYRIQGQFLGVPKRMTITTAGGAEIASLKSKFFSPVKSRMTMTLAEGGTWEVEGSFIEKNYAVRSDGEPIVHVTQKWMTVRDSYTVDAAPGIDPALAMAVVWAIDRWVERD